MSAGPEARSNTCFDTLPPMTKPAICVSGPVPTQERVEMFINRVAAPIVSVAAALAVVPPGPLTAT